MSGHSSPLKPLENAFARVLGIQISYVNNDGVEIFLQRDIFDKVARELLPRSLPFEGEWNEAFLEKYMRRRYARRLPQNAVAWGDDELVLVCRSLDDDPFTSLSGELILDDGTRKNFEARDISWNRIPSHAAPFFAQPLLEARVATGLKVKAGYHLLRTNDGESCHVIAAPKRLPAATKKSWGAFVPAYALRAESDWGSGSYTELGQISSWLADKGAGTVATLPLLPSFLEDWKSDPSPYSPASRLFWNEFYVDPKKSPEWDHSPRARSLFEKNATKIREWKAADYVPYFEIAQLKREILMELAKTYFANGDKKRLERALTEKPRLMDYARFRAHSFSQKSSWWGWSDEDKTSLEHAKVDESLVQFYAYSQMLALEQVSILSTECRRKGLSFYLDLPVGVHSDSYDVWKNPEQYCFKLSAGAPPDPFFTKGQNWGFPPFRPTALATDGFMHFKEILRHHLSQASLLRLDHVMGFHRIYVVPHGVEADRGAYIRFPFEELYATLLLEASRAGARLVGEDLGTVPEEVRKAMNEHLLSRLYVFQYEATPAVDGVVPPAASNTAATLNTHDMPMWAAYWQGLDIPDRIDLGLLNDQSAKEEAETRAAIRDGWLKRLGLPKDAKLQEIFEKTMLFLGKSEAELVLVTLEDAWLEERPQNTPGTWKERRNWERKSRYSLEEIEKDPKFLDFLSRFAKSRE
jgi:4-alpha-glucanotransferase